MEESRIEGGRRGSGGKKVDFLEYEVQVVGLVPRIGVGGATKASEFAFIHVSRILQTTLNPSKFCWTFSS